SFSNNAVSLVEFDDFTGTLPPSIQYPNITFINNTTTNHTITFGNPTGHSFNILGNFTTQRTNSGSLTVNFGSQVGNNISIKLSGNLNVGSGTTLGVGLFNSTHQMTLSRNIVNNGTI